MSENILHEERAAKRPRLSSASDENTKLRSDLNESLGRSKAQITSNSDNDAKESEVGIISYVSEDVIPFQALLKKRYTDFLVNEILPDGEVVHLTELSVPQALNTSGQNREKTRDQGQNELDYIDGAKTAEGTDLSANGQKSASQRSETVVDEKPQTVSMPGEISEKDRQQLTSYLNEDAVLGLLKLYAAVLAHPARKPKDHDMVRTTFTSDRDLRAEIHGTIRRVFSSKIESSTDKDGYLCLTAANTNSKRSNPRSNGNDPPKQWFGKLDWLERGGDYLHFTLYKENKDTMEVISFLVRQLKLSAKSFQFAGTKDRRAVTAQRVSAYRLDAQRLARQNHTLHNSGVGNFEYKPSSLELGDLGGNEFVLTLRECEFPTMVNQDVDSKLLAIQSALDLALINLYNNGFLNYYGLQRFGTFTTRTDTIGQHILKNDFEAACEAILHYHPDALAAAENQSASEASTPTQQPHTGPGRDDVSRAKAINLYQKTSNPHKALEILPRKFSAENQIMRHLSRSPKDYVSALLGIPRNLRLMYVHAYQSFVWNKAATHRWQLYGNKVTEGDLVLVKEHKDKEVGSTTASNPLSVAPAITAATAATTGDIDADGEIIITPSAHDRSNQLDDVFERARALTANEAASGQYTIFDIVLPLPGYDILYPANASGEFYKMFMGSDDGGNLDPYDMRRKQRDFSLSGGYRKLLARIEQNFSVHVHKYAKDEEQFVKTDLEMIKERQGSLNGGKIKDRIAGGGVSGNSNVADVRDVASEDMAQAEGAESVVKDKVAAVLKFQLGASQYATMALRELSRGGVAVYKADFSGGR